MLQHLVAGIYACVSVVCGVQKEQVVVLMDIDVEYNTVRIFPETTKNSITRSPVGICNPAAPMPVALKPYCITTSPFCSSPPNCRKP